LQTNLFGGSKKCNTHTVLRLSGGGTITLKGSHSRTCPNVGSIAESCRSKRCLPSSREGHALMYMVQYLLYLRMDLPVRHPHFSCRSRINSQQTGTCFSVQIHVDPLMRSCECAYDLHPQGVLHRSGQQLLSTCAGCVGNVNVCTTKCALCVI
jgi:hypothetical protein